MPVREAETLWALLREREYIALSSRSELAWTAGRCCSLTKIPEVLLSVLWSPWPIYASYGRTAANDGDADGGAHG